MFEKWRLKDVILLAFLSIFFGGVFVGSGYLFDILTLILAPLGLQAFANEILFGLWCMAAPIAAIFVPRVGSATIGEVLAALAEVLYGSQFVFSAFCTFLASGTFYFRLFLLYYLGSCHCQTLSSVCSWREGIDGAGTTSDSVPNLL